MSESWVTSELPHTSASYRDAVHLRQTILRDPLGLTLLASDLASESDSLHYGLFSKPDDQLLACCVVKCEDQDESIVTHYRLRQMAVAAAYQSMGLGTKLLVDVETMLAGKIDQRSRFQIELHARETAINFYSRLGYRSVGEPFEEIGLRHQRMCKTIDGRSDSTIA